MAPFAAAVEVLTQHNDASRTGANLQEVLLAPANVSTTQFGKLFVRNVDGAIWAQPLYVPGLTISNQTHNVVFVATEHNSVYAFDADNAAASNPLWQVNLGTSVPQSELPGNCGDLPTEVGITGTPVIDPVSATIYVDAKTKVAGLSSTNYFHTLHALDLLTGSEKLGGPVVIQATLSGQTFDALHHHNRPGLVLLSNVMYVAFGSHCDQGTYHGWLLGYNATNLSQRLSGFVTTPNGSQGAIWSCGMAPAVDTNGFLYVVTGNGTFDANTGGSDYGQSFIKFSTTNGLKVADWFAPWNAVSLSGGDQDIGTGGAVLLPGSSLMLGLDKSGTLFLLNQTNLGHFSLNGSSDTNIVEEFSATASTPTVGQCPVYWNGPTNQYIFIDSGNAQTKSFLFTGATIRTTPLATGSVTQGRAGGVSLSANGNTNGILWVTDNANNGTVRAYNPPLIPFELWDSQMNAARDSLGAYVKFCSPTIANGKVYVATASTHQLVVYGSFATPAFLLAASPSSRTVVAGLSSIGYSISIVFTNSFANPVSLSVSSLPAGVSASFNPPSVDGSAISTLSVTASSTASPGTYPLIVNGNAGSLTNSVPVTLVVVEPSSPVITTVALAGTNLLLGGTNGPAGATYYLLASTNAALPVTNWTAVSTGAFDGAGNFALTNVLDPTLPQRFFLLQVP